MRTVTDLLTEIPDLAAEVEATLYAPHRDGRAARGRSVPASRPPVSIPMLYATLPAGDAEYGGQSGLRGTLAMCCRIVIEEMADEGLIDIPDWPADTWAGICDWLTATADWWTETAWADDILRDITTVHAELSAYARVQREVSYRCPRCSAPMHLQSGGQWLQCDAGHQESARLEASYRRRPMAPARELAAEFGVTAKQIYNWRARGELPAVDHRGGELWAYPWDVLLLANPSIAEAIATRDTLSGA